jgi:hypothetical protein
MRTPLDRHVEVNVIVLAFSHPVDMREGQSGMRFSQLIQLMCKTHHAKVEREVSIVIRRVVVVDTGKKRGDGINESGFVD